MKQSRRQGQRYVLKKTRTTIKNRSINQINENKGRSKFFLHVYFVKTSVSLISRNEYDFP